MALLNLDQQQACLFLQQSKRQLFDVFRAPLVRDYFIRECVFKVKRIEAIRQKNNHQFNFFLKLIPIFPVVSVAGWAISGIGFIYRFL